MSWSDKFAMQPMVVNTGKSIILNIMRNNPILQDRINGTECSQKHDLSRIQTIGRSSRVYSKVLVYIDESALMPIYERLYGTESIGKYDLNKNGEPL
jgi:hypothetical protein